MSSSYRAEFDIPRDVCYLNAAYMGVQPRSVVEAALAGARRRAQPWQIKPDDFFSDVEELRTAFARLIQCKPENIAIVPSAGYGIACAAANLPLRAGDVVLTMHDQFPSNYYAWRRKCLATGAEVVVVEKAQGQSWAQAIRGVVEEYSDRIAIAALEGHHWATAETVDLDEIVPALRNSGAKIVLDLTQTIGGSPVDIGQLSPDFMVAAGYKWQFAPYGVAFLYVDEDHFAGLPIEEAWINRAGAEDFSRLSEFTDAYQAGARRFDMSEKSSFSNIAGALAAQQVIADWGIETIRDALASINLRIAAILQQHGFETASAATRAAHFQSAQLPKADPRTLASRLIDDGVFASVRGQNLRVAPHLYTDDEDLDRFDRALAKALR